MLPDIIVFFRPFLYEFNDVLLLENWPFTDIYTEKSITGRYLFHADRAAKPLKFPQALEWEKSYKHKHKKGYSAFMSGDKRRAYMRKLSHRIGKN